MAWNDAERTRLYEAQCRLGHDQWDAIAGEMPGRSLYCLKRQALGTRAPPRAAARALAPCALAPRAPSRPAPSRHARACVRRSPGLPGAQGAA